MTLAWLLVLPMTLLGAVASYYLKRASGAGGLRALLACRALYAGAALYLLSALMNVYVLRYLDYSVALPLTSLTYVWTMLLSRRLLGERIARGQWLGTACIALGAALLVLG